MHVLLFQVQIQLCINLFIDFHLFVFYGAFTFICISLLIYDLHLHVCVCMDSLNELMSCSKYNIIFKKQEVRQEIKKIRDIAIRQVKKNCNCKTFLPLLMTSYNFTSFFAESTPLNKRP